MRVEIKVYDAPTDHFTVPMAAQVKACLEVAVQQCVNYIAKRPRSRTTTGLITGHDGNLITLEFSRVKVITVNVKPARTGGK